ncbi:MAG: type II secretion system GspH family protein [Lentisphaeraceae bacterium]|nr:type II secretion system GspH family protein [Lentisphaeraceae bacterium]
MKKFTLIELLVVISIFGILLTLLLPSIANAKKKGYTAICLSNLRQTSIGNQLFSVDNNGAIVKTYYKSAAFYYGWDLSLEKYLGESFTSPRNNTSPPNPNDVGYCPSYNDLSFQYVKPGASALQKPSFAKDGNKYTSSHTSRYRSYGINEFLSNSLMLGAGYPGNGKANNGSWYDMNVKNIKMAQVDYPGETMLFSEIYNSQKLVKWSKAYFNPNHSNSALYSKIDTSAGVMKYSSIINDGIGVNSTGNGIRNGLTPEEIRFWGASSSPRF